MLTPVYIKGRGVHSPHLLSAAVTWKGGQIFVTECSTMRFGGVRFKKSCQHFFVFHTHRAVSLKKCDMLKRAKKRVRPDTPPGVNKPSGSCAPGLCTIPKGALIINKIGKLVYMTEN